MSEENFYLICEGKIFKFKIAKVFYILVAFEIWVWNEAVPFEN